MTGWIVALALVSLALAAFCVWLWLQRRRDGMALAQAQADAFSRVSALSARGQALEEALVRAEAVLVAAQRQLRASETRRAVEEVPDDQVARDLAAALAARRAAGPGAVVGDRPAGGTAGGAALPSAGALPAGADGGGDVAGVVPDGREGSVALRSPAR